MLVATTAYATRNPDLLNVLEVQAKSARECLQKLVDQKRTHHSPVFKKATGRSGTRGTQGGKRGHNDWNIS